MYDMIKDPKPLCPTCEGRVWSIKLGKWLHTRETVDMVCQSCGKDYCKDNITLGED